MMFISFVFCKQKTAYDLRISDWSADVCSSNLKIDPRSFEEGVDRVSTIATEKTRAVKMALDKDKITLSVTSPENVTAAAEVPGDYTSLAFEIGFNSRYLARQSVVKGKRVSVRVDLADRRIMNKITIVHCVLTSSYKHHILNT